MDKNKLKDLINQKKSQREIAKELNKSQSSIRYWLKKYNLKTQRERYNTGFVSKYKCSCGEINPDKFYGNKKHICGKCHNQYTLKKGQEKRIKAVKSLGGKCFICGYNRFSCSLDFHHLDSANKDPNFASMRGWSWKKIKKEIKGCVLLCKNCHSAYHSGYLKL